MRGRGAVRTLALVLLWTVGATLAVVLAGCGGHKQHGIRRGVVAPSVSCTSTTVTATGTTIDPETIPAHTVAVDGSDVSTIPPVTVPGVTVADQTGSVTACATASTVTETETVTTTVPAVTATTPTTTAPATVPATTTAPATTTQPVTTAPSSTGKANLWIDAAAPSAATCAPASSLADYDPAKACTSMDQALKALPMTGGLILMRCGNYGGQTLTATAKIGVSTFQSETGKCAQITGSIILSSGVNYVTLDSLTVHGGIHGSSTTGVGTNNDTVSNSDVNVGQTVQGTSISFSVGDHISILSNHIGPTMYGSVAGCTPGCGSPEGIRIGKPSTAAATCTTQVCHLVIDNNDIDYVTRNVAYWPASGYGPVPGVGCPNSDGCHEDGIHIWGADGIRITRNRLYGDECQGIFLENTNASLQRDGYIVNNAISTLVGGCGNKGIYISAGGTQHAGAGFAGAWTIAFNSGNSSLIGPNGCGSCQPGTTWDITGNNMILFITNTSGNNAGCPSATNPSWPGATFRYNVWLPGGTAKACGPNDTLAAAAFANPAVPPATGIDMHLSGPTIARGYVPAAVCAAITATDFEGDVRSGACNAGADE